MKNKILIGIVLLLLVIIFAGCTLIREEGITLENVDAIIEEALNAYDNQNINSLQYNEYQRFHDTGDVFDTTVYIVKPDKMRIDYNNRENNIKSLIFNGEERYEIDWEGNVAKCIDTSIQKLTRPAIADTLRGITAKYDLKFVSSEELNGVEAYKFNAIIADKGDKYYGNVKHNVWMDKQTLLPLKDIAYFSDDPTRVHTTVENTNYKVNEAIDESLFSPSEGVDIEDKPCGSPITKEDLAELKKVIIRKEFASISANFQDNSIVLTWNSDKATECIVEKYDLAGITTLIGDETSGSATVSPTETASYTLTCTGDYGYYERAKDTISLNSIEQREVLSANPSSVTAGETSSLQWSVTDAASCTVKDNQNRQIGSGTSGTITVNPAETADSSGIAGYLIECLGVRSRFGGIVKVVDTVTVTTGCEDDCSIGDPKRCFGVSEYGTCGYYDEGSCLEWGLITCPAGTTCQDGECVEPTTIPTVDIFASLDSITLGESLRLRWGSANVDSCTITDQNNDQIGSGLDGDILISPTTTITYTAACTGSAGTASDSVTVTVS